MGTERGRAGESETYGAREIDESGMDGSNTSLLETSSASIRHSIRSGTSCGSWITLGDPETARLFARTSGFPWLCLDLEHSAIDLRDAGVIFAVVADAGVAPLVRVPRGTHENIKRVLDAGAFGVSSPL